MELVVIEKNAYLRLKQQVEDLSTQIEAVKKKFGSVEKENEWMPRKSVWF